MIGKGDMANICHIMISKLAPKSKISILCYSKFGAARALAQTPLELVTLRTFSVGGLPMYCHEV